MIAKLTKNLPELLADLMFEFGVEFDAGFVRSHFVVVRCGC